MGTYRFRSVKKIITLPWHTKLHQIYNQLDFPSFKNKLNLNCRGIFIGYTLFDDFTQDEICVLKYGGDVASLKRAMGGRRYPKETEWNFHLAHIRD